MIFTRMDASGSTFSYRQPSTEEQWDLVRECVAGCPTEAVGISGIPMARDLAQLLHEQDEMTQELIRLELSYKDAIDWNTPQPLPPGHYHFRSSSGLDLPMNIESGPYPGMLNARCLRTLERLFSLEHRCDIVTGHARRSEHETDYLIGRVRDRSVSGHHVLQTTKATFQIHTWELRPI